MSKETGIAADILSLPSGGPEMQPLGDKFQPDLYSGTGNFSIPLSLPPAQNGLAPDLTLAYSTGNGGGPFGLGWDIWTMRLSRATQKGVPRYRDAEEAGAEEDGEDRFVLAGAEELVPVGEGRYRPMTEAKFWLVRRVDDHWTVTTKDGTVYRLGSTPEARVADEDGTGERVFAWLVDRVTDPNGNRIDWTYRRDGNRLYLDRIAYGPFTVAFDYAERPDPSFDCHAGFRIDTRLRCSGIRILSARAPGNLMRRYRLDYENPEPRGVSLLQRVILAGPGGEGDASLPPTTFTYAPFDLSAASYRRFSSPEGFSPPRDLTDPDTNLVDLSGDGLPDVVDSSSGAPVLWRNLGSGRWGRPKALARFPSGATLGSPDLRFADIEGNGTADLLAADAPTAGFFPNAAGAGWEPMVHYRSALPFALTDPNLRLYDIDGDGRIDAIVAGAESFLLFRNLGRAGWESRPRVVRRKRDLAAWPDLFFDDPHVFVADMNGDGLSDLVHLRSGQVAFWPYLAYGEWGPRVLVENPPVLPRGYDPANLFLVDVDGDGAADLVYVDADRTLIWTNRGGARFSDPVVVAPTPPVGSGTVVVADMLGVGRPGLLFTYPRDLPGAEDYRFLSLGGDVAPYAMTSIDNGMGAVTRIEYRSSTAHLLDDLAAGRPWKTFLPFPLNVVSAISVEDRAAGVVGRTEYRYHDGHYDGLEREFRGFGHVDEIQAGSAAEAAVLRENLFDPGTDPSLTERQRRALPPDLRERQRALRGTLQRLRVFAQPFPGSDAPPELREEVLSTWAVRTEFDGPAGLVLFPHQTESMQTEIAGSASPGPSRFIKVRYTGHDAFGNLLGKEQTTGVIDAGGAAVEDSFRRETYDYAAEPAGTARWAVGHLARVAVHDRDGVPRSVIRYCYDGEAFVGLPFGQVERGNLSRLEELVWRAGEPLPEGFGAFDPVALGYHEAGSDEAADRGWYRDKLRQRFNPNGTVAELMDPRGGKATVAYDPDGVYPAEVVDAAGLRTLAAYDHAVEQISALTNASGYTDARAYDSVGRTTSMSRTADDGTLQLARVIRYDAGDSGAVPVRPASITTLICRDHGRQVEEFADAGAPPEGLAGVFIQRVFYGGSGLELQRVATSEPGEDGAPRVIVSGARRFTPRGRVLSESKPFFRAGFAFQPAVPGAEPPPAHRFAYDYRGRVVSAVRPDGKERRTLYSPLSTVAFDERDAEAMAKPSRSERFDGQGRLAAVTEFPAADRPLTTTYSYDFNGNLVGIVDAKGAAALDARFDAIGRKMRVSHPDAGLRRYLHDPQGNIVASIDPRGVRLRNAYDSLGRLVELFRVQDGGEGLIRRFRYDDDPDRPGMPFLGGRLAKVEDESGAIRFAYNAAGQPTVSRRTLPDGRVLEAARRYDFLGAIAGVVYPDGAVVEYRYNEALLLKEVPGFVSGIRYNIMAQMAEITYANGVRTAYGYDPLLQRLETIESLGPGDAVLQRLGYEYDATANVTAAEDRTGPATVRQQFGYDGLNRLVSRQVDAAPALSYAYDDAGNATRMDDGVDGDLEYGTAGGANRLARYRPRGAPGAVDLQYDAAGNLTRRGDLVLLDYDPFGRLIRGDRADGTRVDFDYDYRGGRVRRTVRRGGPAAAPEATLFFDDLYEEGPAGRVRYVRSTFGLLAEVSVPADGGAEEVRFHHPDHLGSTALVTGAAGSALARHRYSPYGIAEGPALADGAPRFIGRDFEPELGLYVFGVRFYDPAIGRFVSVDIAVVENPTGFVHFPQALNPYAYAGNNPLRFRDPSGRFLIVAALIGLAIGALIGALVAAEQGGGVGDIIIGALIGGTVGFFTGGFGLLGSALLGAGTSTLFSLIKGDDKIFTSAAIGFAFGALGGMANWIPAVGGEGFWIDAANFTLEVGVDAGLSGLQSGVSNAVAGKNFWDGFASGLLTGALIGSAKVLVFGVKYDPFSKVNRNDVTAQFAKDNAADRSFIASKVQSKGFPDLRGVEFRRHGLFDLVNGGRSFVLGSNVNLASGQEYSVDVLAHEIRHIAQQQALTLGAAQFYTVWTWQIITKGDVMYLDIPANTTFEVPTVP